MSESGEIIRRLVEGGANYQTIGAALGRNRSLVRQVAIGAKPGRNLTDALVQLERRLAGQAVEVPAPERRVSRRGHLAKVRRPTTVRGRSWSASTIKRQAAKSGARSLGHPLADAADNGQQVAVTVSLGPGLIAESYGKKGQPGAGGSVDIRLGDADDVLSAINEGYGGNVTAYLADVMVERGLVSTAADGITGADLVEHAAASIESVELRTFD